MQCLDLLRVLHKEPENVDVYFRELGLAAGHNDFFDAALGDLKKQLVDSELLEFRCRNVLGSMAVMLQSAFLIQHSTPRVANAYCAFRLGQSESRLCGCVPPDTDCRAVIDHAFHE